MRTFSDVPTEVLVQAIRRKGLEVRDPRFAGGGSDEAIQDWASEEDYARHSHDLGGLADTPRTPAISITMLAPRTPATPGAADPRTPATPGISVTNLDPRTPTPLRRPLEPALDRMGNTTRRASLPPVPNAPMDPELLPSSSEPHTPPQRRLASGRLR